MPLFNKFDKFIGTISITAMDAIIEKVYKQVIVDMKNASEGTKNNFNINYNL